jgi:hypothetical protein
MNRKIILVLGLIMAFIPWSGFPLGWKSFLVTLGGIIVAFLAFISRKRKAQPNAMQSAGETGGAVFVENR